MDKEETIREGIRELIGKVPRPSLIPMVIALVNRHASTVLEFNILLEVAMDELAPSLE